MIRPAVEWLTRGALKLAAMGMLFAGIALLAAGFATGSAAATQVAAALLLCGSAAFYLLSARRVLPFETMEANIHRRSPGGSSLLTGLGLVFITMWMFVQMHSGISLWQDMLVTLDGLGFWQSIRERPEPSGLVFAPVAAVLAVPTIQAAAAAMFGVGSIAALILLIVRSSWFARALLACMLMQGAFVFASSSGTALGERVIPAVERAIRETGTREPMEQQRLVEQLQRYRAATSETATTLAWTWAASVVLTSILFLSGRTAAPVSEPADPIAPIDHRAATAGEREQYFADVARRLSRRPKF